MECVEAERDERELGRKVEELLGAGTSQVWVVRLAGERRVEVHRAPGEAPWSPTAVDLADE